MQARRGSIFSTRKIADTECLVGMGRGLQHVEAGHRRAFGLYAKSSEHLSFSGRSAQLRIL